MINIINISETDKMFSRLVFPVRIGCRGGIRHYGDIRLNPLYVSPWPYVAECALVMTAIGIACHDGTVKKNVEEKVEKVPVDAREELEKLLVGD